MKIVLPFSDKRIREIGLYLAEFALEFVPGDGDVNAYDTNDFLMLFDTWYDKFIRYAETNRLVSRGELRALTENFDELDSFIKEAAINTAIRHAVHVNPMHE
ncbi:MAG TPA: hypothetical protein VJ203_16725 [Bacteroidales bacterium]|nr:hypothetical protein [Bacteroidales bacterium]